MLVLLNSPSHDVLKADAKVRFIFIIYKSKFAIVRFFCSEIDVDVHFFILFSLDKVFGVTWNVFTLLGYNVIDGFVKAVLRDRGISCASRTKPMRFRPLPKPTSCFRL